MERSLRPLPIPRIIQGITDDALVESTAAISSIDADDGQRRPKPKAWEITKMKTLNLLFQTLRDLAAVLCVVLVYAGVGTARDVTSKVTLNNAPLSINKSNTATATLNGLLSGMSGSIRIKIKWHAKSLIPNTFNRLKIELLQGSTVRKSLDCYSIHSDKTPKCDFSFTVTESMASSNDTWKLRATNNSTDDVDGFNIEKESSDLNPFVPSFTSYFLPDCSAKSVFYGFGPTAIGPSSIIEGNVWWYATLPGRLVLKLKWHTDTLIPNVFVPLKAELLVNGSLVKTATGYSIHAPNKDKLTITYDAGTINGSNPNVPIKIRLTNESKERLKGFYIANGSDILVPQFASTFTPTCN
jgi:hypothetical protein